MGKSEAKFVWYACDTCLAEKLMAQRNLGSAPEGWVHVPDGKGGLWFCSDEHAAQFVLERFDGSKLHVSRHESGVEVPSLARMR